MLVKNLVSKLEKLGAQYTITTYNNYNYDVRFTINNKVFAASYDIDHKNIQSYSKATGYNNASQETERRWYDNFTQPLRDANR